jgi:hypothetical protein
MPTILNTSVATRAFLLAAMSMTASAFVQPMQIHNHRSSAPSSTPSVSFGVSSRLYYGQWSSDPNPKEDGIDFESYTEIQELEQARASFEQLFQAASVAMSSSTGTDSSTTPFGMFASGMQHQQQQGTGASLSQQPILTTGARRRRQLEMDLVKSLLDSDQAADELVHLWMHETGDAQAAAVMSKMQETCSAGLVREESDLQQMIAQYPTWAEPRVRLAFVYYFQDRMAESTQMAKEAVECKPWHFEGLRLLVLLSGHDLMLGQMDTPQALLEAHKAALPALRPTLSDGVDNTVRGSKMSKKRRQVWVDRSVGQAEHQWNEAEEVTQLAFSDARLQLQNGLAFE